MVTVFRQPPQIKTRKPSESQVAAQSPRDQHPGKRTEKAVPNIRLTTRDIAILEAVYTYRALTTQHIETLLFSPSTRSRCSLRLKYLYHHGYVLRTGQPQELTAGRKPYVYWLAPKGAALLARNQGIVEPEAGGSSALRNFVTTFGVDLPR